MTAAPLEWRFFVGEVATLEPKIEIGPLTSLKHFRDTQFVCEALVASLGASIQ